MADDPVVLNSILSNLVNVMDYECRDNKLIPKGVQILFVETIVLLVEGGINERRQQRLVKVSLQIWNSLVRCLRWWSGITPKKKMSGFPV